MTRPGLLGVALASAALLAAPRASYAQDLERADSVVRDWVDRGAVPGAVLVIARDGERLFGRAYGWARSHEYGEGQYPDAAASGASGPAGPLRLADPVPMTVGTAFDLASVTKVMATTMAVMLLADDGRLDVRAPVSRYLPDFTGDGRERITLEHLLTHRSGLPQWLPVYYHADDAASAYDYIRAQPLTWEVGAERHYSDLGFMLLGLVVERVTGQRLDHFLAAELYEPLGLVSTGFLPREGRRSGPRAFAATSHGNPFERRMVHDPDFGYRIEGDPDAWSGWRRYTLSGEVNDGNAFHAFGGVAGHAGLFSTAGELATLLDLLLRSGEVGGRRYLSEGVVERFLASTGDGQALGWQLPAYAPAGAFGHTGFTGTFVLGVPETGLAVVLLTNRQNGGVDDDTQYPDVGPLQRAVTRALTGAR